MEVTPGLVDLVYEFVNSDEPTIGDFEDLSCDRKLSKGILK
jgi:hypothetical protein